MEDLSNKRKIYNSDYISDNELKENPLEVFRDWYTLTEKSGLVPETNAMAVTTIENGKIPRTRMVLLKQYSWEGFTFYTNYNSRKGKSIAENPEVCLHFYWDKLEKQIIINGRAEKIAPNLSDGYFHTRPRGSQLGALASPQSQEIPNRDYLENKLKELEKEYENKEITRPEDWGGFIVKPHQIEFWKGRPNRLHDRILYTLDNNLNWNIKRLAP